MVWLPASNLRVTGMISFLSISIESDIALYLEWSWLSVLCSPKAQVSMRKSGHWNQHFLWTYPNRYTITQSFFEMRISCTNARLWQASHHVFLGVLNQRYEPYSRPYEKDERYIQGYHSSTSLQRWRKPCHNSIAKSSSRASPKMHSNILGVRFGIHLPNHANINNPRKRHIIERQVLPTFFFW